MLHADGVRDLRSENLGNPLGIDIGKSLLMGHELLRRAARFLSAVVQKRPNMTVPGALLVGGFLCASPAMVAAEPDAGFWAGILAAAWKAKQAGTAVKADDIGRQAWPTSSRLTCPMATSYSVPRAVFSSWIAGQAPCPMNVGHDGSGRDR